MKVYIVIRNLLAIPSYNADARMTTHRVDNETDIDEQAEYTHRPTHPCLSIDRAFRVVGATSCRGYCLPHLQERPTASRPCPATP